MQTTKTIQVLLLLAGFATTIGSAVAAPTATVFNSPYDGQNPGNASDQDGVIGTNGQFDLQSVAFTNLTSTNFTVQIDFNFDYGDASLTPFELAGIKLSAGDLLFNDGGKLWGVALDSHTGFTQGDLYSVTDFSTAKTVLGNPNGTYRPNNDVWMDNNGGQTVAGLGTSTTKNIGGDEVQTTLSFTPSASLISALNSGNLDFQFSSATCSNDYLSGNITGNIVNTVPEPTGFVLLGSGLIALSVIPRLRRRRR
jgi:hypothetical protein